MGITWAVVASGATITPVLPDWQSLVTGEVTTSASNSWNGACDDFSYCFNNDAWSSGDYAASLSSCTSASSSGSTTLFTGGLDAGASLDGMSQCSVSNPSTYFESYVHNESHAYAQAGFTVTPTASTWSVTVSYTVSYGLAGEKTTDTAGCGLSICSQGYPAQVGSPAGLSVDTVVAVQGDTDNCALGQAAYQQLGRAVIADGSISIDGFMSSADIVASTIGDDCDVGRRTTTHSEATDGTQVYTTSFTLTNPAYVRVVCRINNPGEDPMPPNVCSVCDFGCSADVNNDGNADQDDVAAVIDCVAGGGNLRCCDINGDGNTDQDDVAEIIARVAGSGC